MPSPDEKKTILEYDVKNRLILLRTKDETGNYAYNSVVISSTINENILKNIPDEEIEKKFKEYDIMKKGYLDKISYSGILSEFIIAKAALKNLNKFFEEGEATAKNLTGGFNSFNSFNVTNVTNWTNAFNGTNITFNKTSLKRNKNAKRKNLLENLN